MRTLITFVLIASTVSAEEVPLKEVWAAHMPGTRDLRELEPRTEGDEREFGPLTHTIIRTMMGGRGERAWGRPDAGPGFPVQGTGIAALHRVYDVIVDDVGLRPETVPAGEVSIVFFSRGIPCRLEKIEREGNVITLSYRLHARRTASLTCHLALIPLGELSPGKYSVKTVQLPIAKPGGAHGGLLQGERLKRTISDPFSFEVQ